MKYQLVISSDSLEELQQVTYKLQNKTQRDVGLPVASVPSLSTAGIGDCVRLEVNEEELGDDDGGEEIEPSAIFGTTPPSFAPNAGATAAPVTPSQPAPSAASQTTVGVELDPRGYPWDGRIHSSSKARLAKNNTWKLARGVAQATVEAVEAELRAQGFGVATLGHSIAPTQPVVQPVAVAPVASAPAMPLMPSMPTAPVAPTTPTAASVKERFTKALSLRIEGLGAPWILQVLNHFGVANLDDLTQHADKAVTINDYLNQVRDSDPKFKEV